MNNIKELLKEHDFTLKKKYGQNFITNSQLLEEIVEKADISQEDVVIEIGPGAGTLTTKIADKAKKVIAIEIDTSLKEILEANLKEYVNIEIIFEDILKWDLKQYIKENYEMESIKVVANLPYYITTPILMKLLEDEIPLKSITVMVQKEVAERMEAKPGTKEYGALTLAINYYSQSKIVMTVPASAFTPPPKVTSAVIRLDLKEKSELSEKEEKALFKLIKAAFGQRRKTLVNALSNKDIADKEMIKKALKKLNISEKIRGEKLSLEEFKELSQILLKFIEI